MSECGTATSPPLRTSLARLPFLVPGCLVVDVDAHVIRGALAAVRQAEVRQPAWAALDRLLAVLKEQAGQIERLQREATETVARSGGELLRGVTSGVCDWTQPNCVRRAAFRLATPHGHMDFCPEHIDYAIASMPTEWVEGWSYREPLAVEGGPDDIPF